MESENMENLVMDQDCLWCCQPNCQDRCPKCGLVAYCSKAHLQNHFGEDGSCLPFRIRFSPSKGRYAEAIRDIEPTELILRDKPLVVGPSRQQQIVCVECLLPVDGKITCPDCQLPMCQKCVSKINESLWHRTLECPFLQKQGFKASHPDTTCKDVEGRQATILPPLLIELASITPLRLILQGLKGHTNYQDLKKDQTPLYEFYHTGQNERSEDVVRGGRVRALEIDMVATMWNKFGLKHYIASENIVRCAIGQLFNNAKSLEATGNNGSGMYGRYCMLNHCCLSNAKCILNEAGTFLLDVRAQTKIKCGEEITTRYVGINVGAPTRAVMLEDHWSFVCTCKRCLDPTELGTYASALRCLACGPGSEALILPMVNKLEGAKATKWCCNTCEMELSREQVEAIVETGLRIIKNNTSNPPEVKLLEHVTKELSVIFHNNHYLVMQVKFVLLKLLTSQSSQCQTTSDWAKLNVVALSLLSVLDKLDPGASRNRGKVLKDLIQPFMKLAECELKAGVIDESDFKIRKKMAQQFAKDLINCYKHENVLQFNKN